MKMNMTPSLTSNLRIQSPLRTFGEKVGEWRENNKKEQTQSNGMQLSGFWMIRMSILQESPLVFCISILSQMMAHLLNVRSNEVKFDTKIDVLNEIHTMM